MKTFFALFGIFCVVATAILITLTHDGVSVRTAPIISPSLQGEEYKNVAKSVVSRLFPDFQMSHYVVIGSPENLKMGPQIINEIKIGFEEQFKKTVTLLSDNENLTAEAISKCLQPCWILTSETQANELSENNKIPQILNKIENGKHFHITLVPFSEVQDPSQDCIAEKRLSLECLIPVSIHEVRKKFKDPKASYFFMRKYQDRDYFLFIQN